MSVEDDLRAEVARLQEEVTRLSDEITRLKNPSRELSLKVSPKGALSVYGLGRFPVTLYKEQWTRLLDHADAVRAFLQEHETQLKAKP